MHRLRRTVRKEGAEARRECRAVASFMTYLYVCPMLLLHISVCKLHSSIVSYDIVDWGLFRQVPVLPQLASFGAEALCHRVSSKGIALVSRFGSFLKLDLIWGSLY